MPTAKLGKYVELEYETLGKLKNLETQVLVDLVV